MFTSIKIYGGSLCYICFDSLPGNLTGWREGIDYFRSHREIFWKLKSRMCSDILKTISVFIPKKKVLEIIVANPPMYMQLQAHGTNFVTKMIQLSQNDAIKVYMGRITSLIVNKLRSDWKFLDKSNPTQEINSHAIIRWWTKTISNTFEDDNNNWVNNMHGLMPKLSTDGKWDNWWRC